MGKTLKWSMGLFAAGGIQTCTQCGKRTNTYERYKSGLFGSYIFCCAGCVNAFAQNNGMTVNRIPKRWSKHGGSSLVY